MIVLKRVIFIQGWKLCLLFWFNLFEINIYDKNKKNKSKWNLGQKWLFEKNMIYFDDKEYENEIYSPI